MNLDEIYERKTPLEHILLRPDTYIGSIHFSKQFVWILENEKFNYKEIVFVPGLYKIYDEIIVNAIDNKQRDNSTSTIKVTIKNNDFIKLQ